MATLCARQVLKQMRHLFHPATHSWLSHLQVSRVLFDYKKGNGWVDILISADKVEKVVGVGYGSL